MVRLSDELQKTLHFTKNTINLVFYFCFNIGKDTVVANKEFNQKT